MPPPVAATDDDPPLPPGGRWAAPGTQPGQPPPTSTFSDDVPLPPGASWASQPPPPQPEPGFLDRLDTATSRGLGLGVRDLMSVFGGEPVANWAGLPKPDRPYEQILSGVDRGALGALSVAIPAGAVSQGVLATTRAGMAVPSAVATRAAAPVASAVTDTLAATPMRQAIVGGAAGGVGGTASAAGLPPWLQTALTYATVLGSGLVPGGGARFSTEGDVPSPTGGPPIAGGGTPRSGLRATEFSPEDEARLRFDMPIYPGQSGNALQRFLFSEGGKYPGSGGTDATRTQQNAINTAVGRTFGAVTDDGKLTPDVMRTARANASNAWANLASNTWINTAQYPELEQGLDAVEANLAGHNAADAQPVLNAINGIREQINNPGSTAGWIGGGWLQKQLDAKGLISRFANGSTVTRDDWRSLQDVLHQAVEDNARPNDVSALQQAQQYWRNLKTVEPMLAGTDGDIRPGSLAALVKNNKFMQSAYRESDLKTLGQIGNVLIKSAPDSGTTSRLLGTAATGGIGVAAGQLLSGRIGAALATAGTVAAPYVGMPVAARLMRIGANSPTTVGGYYQRMLANPWLWQQAVHPGVAADQEDGDGTTPDFSITNPVSPPRN